MDQPCSAGGKPLSSAEVHLHFPLSLSLGSKEDLPVLPNKEPVSPSLVPPFMILGSQKEGSMIQGKKRLLLTGILWIQRTVGPLPLIGFSSMNFRNIVFHHPLSPEFSGRTRPGVLGPGTTTRLLGPTGRVMRPHILTRFSFWKSTSCRAPELGGLLETLESNMHTFTPQHFRNQDLPLH